MGGIILIIVLAVIWEAWRAFKKSMKAEKRQKDAEEKQKREYEETINKSDVKKALWEERVSELNLDLDKAIYVLYCNDDGEAAFYKYLWYEDGALAIFNSVEMLGEWHLATSPKEWKVYYIEKNKIEGIYKRNNYCQINFNDGSNSKFSLDNYDAIKKLLTENGLI